MRPLALWLALVACKAKGAYPIGTGGGPGGGNNGGGNVDAAAGASDAGPTLKGRVCLAEDPRKLRDCAPTGADGLTVSIGGAIATTAPDGTFAITQPQGTNLEWQISGGPIVTAQMTVSALAEIPAIRATTYAELLDSNGVIQVQGEGAVFARVVSGGLPVANATATLVPAASAATFYDGASATLWNQNGTGPEGTLWIPGAASGATSLRVTAPGGGATQVDGIAIGDGTLTFVVVAIP